MTLVSSANPSLLGASLTLSASVPTGANGQPTGTVIFMNAGTALGAGTLDGSGNATLTLSTLPLGQQSLTAVYGGDTLNATSTSAVLAQTIQEPTQTWLLANTNPAQPGAQAIFTAIVTTPGGGTPAGIVTFLDGSTVLGTGTLATSTGVTTATFATSSLTVGSHSITASYAGNAGNAASVSSALTESIEQTTTVAIASSGNPAAAGSSVTLSATVMPAGSVTATGTVTFSEGSTVLGEGALNGSGIGSIQLSDLSPAQHSITASYSGDADNASATSTVFVQTIQQNTSSVLTSSTNPSLSGNAITLTATITPAISGTPTGVVTFDDGSTAIGTGSLNASGVATFVTSALAVGPHSITAVYGGDAINLTSTSDVLTQEVQENTSIALSSSNNPVGTGAFVTFTVTASGFSQTPGGTVTFNDGATVLGTGTMNGSGISSFSTSGLGAGSHSIVASYGGDSNNLPANSNALTQIILANTTTALSSAPNPSTAGASVTFTAALTSSFAGMPTGAVTFNDGGTTLGSGTLNASGIATYSTTTLAAGSHSMTAVYGGDSSYAGSASTALTQEVQSTTSIALISSLNPAPPGSAVTFTASVTGGTITATGTVTFNDGTAALGTGGLDGSGNATFVTSSLAPGSHSIVAVYAGDSDNLGDSSSALAQVVQSNTVTTLTANPSPVSATAAVTFTATVTGGFSTATGSITFKDGTTVLGMPALDSSATAAFITSSLSAGSHTIVAVYAGDANNVASTSLPVTLIVQATTTVALVSASNPSAPGAPVSFTATVTAASGIPTGTVAFKDGASTLTTPALNGSGIAAFAISSLTAGSHSITAIYSGDANYLGNTSNLVTQIVQANTTVTVVSSANPVPFGGAITFTAQVTSPLGIATGTVTFEDGANLLATQNLTGPGTATFSTSSLSAGSHSIVAIYNGDANNLGSTSTALTQIVQAATSLTLSSNLNPSNASTSVVFTAVLRGATGTPTGTVTFSDGSASLGSATLNSSGSASFSSSTLAGGSHTITAQYGGDANNQSSSSNVVTQVVKLNTSTVVSANINPVSVGTAVTFTATVTANTGTPTGSVIFQDSGVTLASQPLTGGIATFISSTLAVGSHAIVASYSGDAFNASSSSTMLSEIVQATTSVALSSSLNPSSPGINVTFTATVTGSSGTPVGTVSFQSGAAVLGSATLNASGIATYSIASLSLGMNSVTAVYAGSTNFAGSTSSALPQSVEQTGVMTLASSGSPSQPGSAVTFIAVITGTSPTATGSVTFNDGSVALGTATLNVSGAASFTTSSLPLGTHTITASYGGDADSAPENSNPWIQSIQQNTVIALSSNNPVALTETSVTFTAAVSGRSITPSGTVTFLDGNTALGTGTLDAGGHATYSTSSLTLGAHSITAEYAGDANSLTSSSMALAQTIQEPTSTSITSNNNPSQTGTSVTFSTTVTTSGAGTPTGSIIYLDGTTVLGSATLNNQQAAFSITSLSNGPHSITAVYGGDASNMASTSILLVQNVQASTSTPLVSSLNPSVAGQSITLTATVQPAGSYTPTGTITFDNGGSPIGTAALSTAAGITSASISTAALAPGTQSLTAVYSGDANNSPSTSLVLEQVVEANTSVSLVGSGSPSLLGNSVAFTATVPAGANGQPTGSITFDDGSAALGTGTLDGSGVTTFITSNLSLGAHSITAVYGGDATNAPSTSSPVTQNVQEQTQVQTASNVNPSQPGAAVTFTATVTATGPGTPTGSVTFSDGSTSIGTASLSTASGVTTATFSTSTLALGPRSITAAYAGDAQNAASTSPAIIESVAQTTTISLQAAPNPAPVGNAVTLTASVTPSGPTVATGTITFYDGATVLGTETLSSGTSSITLSSLSPGSHTITASYGGDIDNGSSTSTPLTLSIQQTTITTLTVDTNPSVSGSTIALTATVAASVTGIPTGSVSFNEGSTVLGMATVNGSGIATLSLATLAAGQHSIIAVYSGDAANQTSTSNTLVETVQQNSSMQLTTSGTPAPSGSFITFTATLTPGSAGVPTGTVTFKDSTTLLGTATLNNAGVATFATQSLGVGSHSIVATYSGDADNLPGSATLTQIVQAATATTVVSSLNPATPATAVTFTIAVATSAGTATGTVILQDGAAALTSLTLNSSGMASYSSSTLAVGTHAIAAIYSGDANHMASTSAAVSEVIKSESTTVTLSISNPSPALGSAVTLSALVGGLAPTGTVSFYDGTIVLGTATLNASGGASFTISSLGAGTHSFTAVYGGDLNNAGATSSSIIINIGASSAVSLNSSFNPSVANAVVIFTSTVSGNGGTPTGTVTFFDGSAPLGSSTLDASGNTSFAISQLTAGSHIITATYAGDSVFSGSTSPALSETVFVPSGPKPTITITVVQDSPNQDSPNARATLKNSPRPNLQIAANTPVTLAATVFISNVPVTQGTVTFFDGTVALATQLVNSAGAASTFTILDAGTHSLFATYNGSNSSSVSTSVVTSVLVNPIISNVLTASGNPGNYTLTAVITGNAFGLPSGTATFVDGTNNTTLGHATVTPCSVQILPIRAPGSPISISGKPVLVAEGDFDGDQNADLAVIDSSAGTVTILMDNGTGLMTVATGSPIALGASPVRITSADFNGDGKDDLAIATNGGNVIILLSDGGGQFHAAASSPIRANGSASIVSGDFNGDGRADLAVADDSSSGSVSILIGDGTGNFTLAGGSPFAMNSPSAIAIGDFNQDGQLDLAITNASGNQVSVVLGNGTGSFSSAANSPFATGANPVAVVVGDFNGDGKLDLVTANQGSGSGNPGAANLTILLGDGSGNFGAAAGSPFALSGIPVALSAGPIASPQAGLAIANQGGTITVLQSNAVGNFSEAAGSPVSMSSSLAAMVVKDFDNDGKPDFAALDSVSDSLILKLNRTASSSTIVATNIAVTGGGSHSVTAVYSGDSIYPASTSDAVTLTATTAPDFTIASATASQTIAPGQTGNYTISLTAQNGFTGAVALSCSGLPSGYTCGFTPPSLTLSAAIATSVMTVSSTSIAWTGDGKINLARLSSIQPFRRSMVWLLSSMTLFLLALARKASTKGYAVRLACMMIVFAAAVSMQGCGNAPLTPPLSTTYTVTVTGTSGTLTHSTSVTLITKVAE